MKPPQMNPEILRATTLFTLWLCVLGLGNVGCPVWSIVRGRSEKAYEAKMDVRPTSVPPPGRVLSAATLPHTLDEKKKGHSPQSLRKHAGFCLSSKQKPGPLSRSHVCISQSSEGSRCVSQTVAFQSWHYGKKMETKWKHTLFLAMQLLHHRDGSLDSGGRVGTSTGTLLQSRCPPKKTLK